MDFSQFPFGHSHPLSTAQDLAPLPPLPSPFPTHQHTIPTGMSMSSTPVYLTPPALKPETLLETVDRLKFFLATAPGSFDSQILDSLDPVQREERLLNRFLLPTGEYISCVLWGGLYHITGTDIVRALHFRFLAFGRPVRNVKKFEEGIFSDLRNLKSGADATLEEPKSPFLELLFKYNCIRTQKKQKVFYWFSVPHDRLFLDALDRDLKREKLGVEATTEAIAEPALSFVYNPQKSLYEQFTQGQQQQNPIQLQSLHEGKPEKKKRPAEIDIITSKEQPGLEYHSGDDKSPSESQVLQIPPGVSANVYSRISTSSSQSPTPFTPSPILINSVDLNQRKAVNDVPSSSVFGNLNLFEGSPSYKQRRKPGIKKETSNSKAKKSFSSGPHSGSIVGSHHFHHPYQLPTSSSAPPYPTDQFHSVCSPLHQAASSTPNLMSISPMSSGMPSPQMSFGISTPPISSGSSTSFSLGHQPSTLPFSNDFSVSTFPEYSPINSVPPQLQSMDNSNGFAGSKVYVCPLYSCGKLFKRLEHLKRHVRSHTLEKPFSCPQCDKKFARSDNLSVHLKEHDRGNHDKGNSKSSDRFFEDIEDEELVAMATMVDGIDSRSSPEVNDEEFGSSSKLHTRRSNSMFHADGSFSSHSILNIGGRSPQDSHISRHWPASMSTYSMSPLQRSESVSSYATKGSLISELPAIRRHNSAAPSFNDLSGLLKADPLYPTNTTSPYSTLSFDVARSSFNDAPGV